MRELFGELSVTLEITKEKATVPNIDVENRWNSMFNMIDACFKFEKVLEALCYHEKLSVRLQDYRLNSLEWKVLKSNKDVLECAFKCTNIASGKNYATLSMQPFIWELLENICRDAINGSTQTGFTTPAVKMAASAMLEKLLVL
jgi:hypothetical protein